jgi:hypothetical protein
MKCYLLTTNFTDENVTTSVTKSLAPNFALFWSPVATLAFAAFMFCSGDGNT